MKTIVRLEQLLEHWELGMEFLNWTLGTVGHEAGQPIDCPEIKHFSFVREALLGRRSVASVWHIGYPPPDSKLEESDLIRRALGGQCAECIPRQLLSWHKDSRRVYHLSEDLEVLLRLTSLKDVNWGDIRLPFPSFVITLNQPLEGRYDCIILSTILDALTGTPLTFISLLPRTLGEACQTSRRNFGYEAARDLAGRGRWKKLAEHIGPAKLESVDVVTFAFNMAAIAETPVATPLSRYAPAPVGLPVEAALRADIGAQANDDAMRIIAGLCLYLKTLPPGSPLLGPWVRVRPPSTGKRKPKPSTLITDAAQVCTVASTFVLTHEERAIVREHGASGLSLSPHFREGHWRRPPGKGSDPTAEKTVWVRPTVVNRHKLAEGELPGGAEKTIVLLKS